METLHQLLVDSARENPNSSALDCNGRVVSYLELDELSTQIAQSLKSRCKSPAFRAAVFLPKSIESVAAIFGILKAGGTYVPLDIEAPETRNQFITSDCETHFVIGSIDSDLEWVSPDLKPATENLNFLDYSISIATLSPKKETGMVIEHPLAYILYTSGSTGQPKGVMFTHSNALSFIHWCSGVFSPTSDSVFSSHAPFHFDLSILDLYLSIKHGAKLVLIDHQTGKNPRALAHLIEEKGITHWYSTPTILKLILLYGKPERRNHRSLRFVLFAGEVFPPDKLHQLSRLWPDARFFNLYGPTETNVCTYFEIPKPVPVDRQDPYPIGKTCEHLSTQILSLPSGDSELCVSGSAVAHSYWNNAGANSNSFFIENGKKWYKTGDLVKISEEGDLVFKGRKDRMVKKNGFRIELGEIENTLNRHSQIADVAVSSVYTDDYECRITAFIQARESAILNMDNLKTYCQERLPHYMTPDRFIELDSIPKTSTDKTDYQELKKICHEL